MEDRNSGNRPQHKKNLEYGKYDISSQEGKGSYLIKGVCKFE